MPRLIPAVPTFTHPTEKDVWCRLKDQLDDDGVVLANGWRCCATPLDKGLERRVVALAFNEDGRRDRAKERFYVGLSRATDKLVVMGDATSTSLSTRAMSSAAADGHHPSA